MSKRKCRDHKRYADRLAALLAASTAAKDVRFHTVERIAYECSTCGGWHLRMAVAA